MLLIPHSDFGGLVQLKESDENWFVDKNRWSLKVDFHNYILSKSKMQ